MENESSVQNEEYSNEDTNALYPDHFDNGDRKTVQNLLLSLQK